MLLLRVRGKHFDPLQLPSNERQSEPMLAIATLSLLIDLLFEETTKGHLPGFAND
jgi:hypothetical protein